MGNKIDLPDAQANLPLLQERVNVPVIAVSAKFGTSILLLLKHLRSVYDEQKLKSKLNLSQ